MSENDNAREELRVITKREFNRTLNDEQLSLLLRLVVVVAPGDWRDKGRLLHEYIETAIEGLDSHSGSHPSLVVWGNGGING